MNSSWESSRFADLENRFIQYSNRSTKQQCSVLIGPDDQDHSTRLLALVDVRDVIELRVRLAFFLLSTLVNIRNIVELRV
jgi:hypothetical protein